MVPTPKKQPKAEPRFFNGIWLGRDTTTGASFTGTAGKVVRARTIRRQVEPHKYNSQLLTKRQRTTGTMIEGCSVAATATATEESSAARRQLDDAITRGSEAKQQKRTEQQTAAQRPEPDPTQPTSKMRINAITVTLNNGKQVTTATSEDQQEVRNEQRLLEPIIYNTEVRSNKGQTRNDEGDEFNETTRSIRGSSHQQNNTRGERQHH